MLRGRTLYLLLAAAVAVATSLACAPVDADAPAADEPSGAESLLAGLGEGYTSLWGAGGASLENALIIVSYVAIGLGFLGATLAGGLYQASF